MIMVPSPGHARSLGLSVSRPHQVSVGVGNKCPLASLHQARDQLTGPQSQQDGHVISLPQGKMAGIVKCLLWSAQEVASC